GDVIGGIMLAHVASYEGVCTVENIAGHANRVPDYHAAPNCVYTDPEIAHVGLGEKEAKEKGIAVKIGRFPFAAAGRALTLGQTSPTGGGVNTDPAASGGNSPQGGEVSTPTANMQNRGEKMSAPVKSSSRPPTPSAINPKVLELTKNNREFLLGMHRQMQLIRRFEERAQEQYTKAKIGGYCHLNIGEEATVVGGILALKANDWIFTSYREHGHAIARGVDPKAVMAELFGKETGTSHGRGGSMHLVDHRRRFMGGYGIVGGHLPLAVG